MLNNLAANNIRAELARRSISASEAAVAIGLSKQAFSNRMTGKKPFNIEELEGIAQLLECNIFTLLQESTEESLTA